MVRNLSRLYSYRRNQARHRLDKDGEELKIAHLCRYIKLNVYGGRIPEERVYEFKRIMQCNIYLMKLSGVDYGYDDFKLQVVGIHSLKLSKDISHWLMVENFNTV